MYDFLDRAVGDMAEPDIFIVSAMRGWVAAARSGRCACAALGRGFAQRGVADALGDFMIAMATIDADAHRRLRFAPVVAPFVTDDEAGLLALFAMGRGGAPDALRRAASSIVEGEAVTGLEKAVCFVGDAMMGDAA